MDSQSMLPPTPRRAAAQSLLQDPDFNKKENPMGAEMDKLFIDRDLFPAELKEGDTVCIEATVGSIGSKVAIMPYKAEMKGDEDESGEDPAEEKAESPAEEAAEQAPAAGVGAEPAGMPPRQ